MASTPRSFGRALLAGWPLPHWVSWAVVAVNGAAAFASSFSLLRFPYGVWTDTSRQWHEGLFPLAALTAAVSALVAATLFRRSSLFALRVRPRLGLPSTGWQCAATAGWAVGGYAVGMLPLSVKTALTATSGSVRILDVLVGLAGVAAAASLGWAVGQILGVKVAAVAALVVAMVWTTLPDQAALRPIGVMGPVQQWYAGPGFEENLYVSLFSLLFLAAFCVWAVQLAAAAAAGVVTRRVEPHLWLASVAVLAVVAFAWRPELYRANAATSAQAVCSRVDRVNVCVHAAHTKELPRVERAVRRLAAAGERPLLTRVADTDLTPNTRPGRGQATIALGPADRAFPQNLPRLISYAVSPDCAEDKLRGGRQPSQRLIRVTGWSSLVRARILRDAGYRTLAQQESSAHFNGAARAQRRIGAMTPAQFRRFVARNAAGLTGCTFEGGR